MFAKIDMAMDGSENSIVVQLNNVKSEMKSFSSINPQLGGIYERFISLAVDAKELARDLRLTAQGIECNPEKLQFANERYSQLQSLFRKHNVDSSEELQRKLTSLQSEQAGETILQAKMADLQAKITRLQSERVIKANALHQKRTRGLESLCSQVVDQLVQLEMPYAQMRIQLTQIESSFNETGNTLISMLFCANKGQSPMPIEKVASGGELSRISLAIQVITAQTSRVPTLVFDEVDVGIGGPTAEVVGQLLRRLGERGQVLTVTHLPQVAAQGHQHLFVHKVRDSDATRTAVSKLSPAERVEEIARMLGGVDLTEESLAHARQMVSSAQA